MKQKILLFVFLLSCGMASAAGKCGENVSWDLSNGVLTIRGQGAMNDYRADQPRTPWYSKRLSIKSAVIEDGVTYIGNCAFLDCSNLISVDIPNSVTSIGSAAFHECTSLNSVTIGNSVKSIGNTAFYGCTGLTSVTIGNSVETIGDRTFSACSSLTSVTIGNSVKSIGKNAFNGCKNLISVDFPNSIESIGDFAFVGCHSLTSVTLGNNITSIGDRAFQGCRSLVSLNIPNSVVTNIRQSDFSGCTSLTSVSIGNGVKCIEYLAFYQCTGLTTVTIGNGVTNIAKSAFNQCSSLTYVNMGNSVKSIGEWAFSECSNLTTLAIPKSVTSIGTHAFYGCKKLQIYTASSAYCGEDIPSDRIKRISQDQLHYYVPFSLFAKNYVEDGINLWQQKDEFERTSDWRQRVNKQSRQNKIQDLLNEASDIYIAFHTGVITINLKLGKYDADNEVFSVYDDKYGAAYLAVPYAEARDFKSNWDKKQVDYKMQIKDDEIKLASLSIQMPDGKQYTYRNTDAVNYNLAEAEYNFEPIELNFAQSSTSQSKQNVTTTKVKFGASQVDTNIPVTNASNQNTFVIIFANEDYKNVASVPFAKNDGAVFQKYCQKTLGIPVTNIHYVENPSFNDMRIQLAWLNDVCNAFDGQASLIVYYAGHGIPDEASKSAYLLPVDGDGRYVQSAYKLDDMYQKLGAMNAKSVTVFMDACFSGSKRENGMLASARGVAVKVRSGEPTGKMVVFSAATGDETAYPNNDEQHGMFTYYLLKKLQETKGDVTLQDLGNYITTNVRQQSIVKNGKSQTPTVSPSADAAGWQNWKLK